MSQQTVAQQVTITLPDGSTKTYDAPVTPLEIARSISEGLARAIVAAQVNGRTADLAEPITEDATVRLLKPSDPEGLEVLRHSATHLMAQAIKRLYPNACLEDGPPTEEGFWYDIKTDPPITPEDFPKIEAEMKKAAKEKLEIKRSVLNREEAKALFEKRGEPYKLQLLDRIPDGDVISCYEQGEFIDLCRGPHIPHTGHLKAFKLLSVAGAYVGGDARNDQLTRIRGTAFGSKDDLAAHLQMLEEAKKRDHRKVGRELGLFMSHEWAPGETFWLPRGKIVYDILRNMSTDLHRAEGYKEVFTPMLFKKDLFETSGHWKHYRDDMFIVPGQEASTLTSDQVSYWEDKLYAEFYEGMANDDDDASSLMADSAEPSNHNKFKTRSPKSLSQLLAEPQIAAKYWFLFEKKPGEFIRLSSINREVYAVKPMNCPCHMLIFRDRRRSYRELPLRIFDQGVLHRNEASGTLSGLTRVRQFCQDDAHIFLAPNQIEEEIGRVIAIGQRIYGAFGMTFSQVFLSTRPEKAMGTKEQWDQAEAALESAIKANKLEYTVNEGDGAFYGPKIDFQVKDALGREWQTMTIQLDYQLPERFNLKYAAPDGTEQQPIVVHRAIFGSFERFLGIIIEHFAGDFPVWLAPEQVRIMTVSEKSVDYAEKVLTQLRAAGIRAELDDRDDKIGAKKREGRLDRIPFLLTIGQDEADNGTIAVWSRTGGDEGTFAVADWAAKVAPEMSMTF
ncbi:MAG: threonine--tRNA ligase [Sumerlaeia bacterium]